MADTIRDRAALLTLLANNASGDISAQDFRDVVVSVHGVYGGLYVAGGGVAQTGIATSPVLLTGWAANQPSSGTTPDHTADTITVGTAGVYLVALQVSYSGTLNTTFELHIYKNAGDTGFGVHRKLGTGGDVGSGSAFGLVTCAANDTISVYAESDAGGGASMTLVDAQLIVYRIA